MSYADGSLNKVPLALEGSTQCTIDGTNVRVTSTATFPNGKKRVVAMSGTVEGDGPFQLNPESDIGPIRLVMTEIPPCTVLIHELERASGRIVLAGSMSIDADASQITQISHEIGEDGQITGAQVWHFRSSGS